MLLMCRTANKQQIIPVIRKVYCEYCPCIVNMEIYRERPVFLRPLSQSMAYTYAVNADIPTSGQHPWLFLGREMVKSRIPARYLYCHSGFAELQEMLINLVSIDQRGLRVVEKFRVPLYANDFSFLRIFP